MRILSFLVLAAVPAIAIPRISAGDKAEDQRAADKATIAAQQKKIEELERQLASARRELKRMHAKLTLPKQVKIMTIRGMSTKAALFLVHFFFHNRPGFKADTVPDLDCLIIQGDAKTLKEAEDLIKTLMEWGKVFLG
jgi:hypothetical protein